MIDAIPVGFVEMAPFGPFHQLVGPIFVGERDGREVCGMRVLEKHSNLGPFMHGGMFMTLADTAMTRASRALRPDDHGVVTIAFSGEILAPAGIGDWVEAEVEVLRAGRRAIFLNCMLRKGGPGGKPLMRFSGTFQIVRISRP
jgi:uncharacterized protein (TIGR00369 family)